MYILTLDGDLLMSLRVACVLACPARCVGACACPPPLPYTKI